MANNYFQFKEFIVEQADTAMKVGTDGVLLGAWADVSQADAILDIGTGSGLIALMLAQRSAAEITAVEIEEKACRQADKNFKQSKWADRILLVNSSFQKFATTINKKFDLIVSNPPYFVNSMKSPTNERNLARHTDLLPFADLFGFSSKLLKPNGKLALIIPTDISKSVFDEANFSRFSLNKKTSVKSSTLKPPKRLLLEFSFSKTELLENCVTIENQQQHDFTQEYKNLTKDFYLAF